MKRFIWVQVMKGGRKRRNMARNQLYSMRHWCLRVSDKKEKNQRCFTLQTIASSTSRWCMRLRPQSATFLTGLSWTSRFIALSLVHHRARRCKELWVIGFFFFFWWKPQTASFISPSRRLRDRANWNLYIHWLCSYPFTFCYSMFDFCYYKNNGIKTQTTSYIMTKLYLLSFLMFLYFYNLPIFTTF